MACVDSAPSEVGVESARTEACVDSAPTEACVESRAHARSGRAMAFVLGGVAGPSWVSVATGREPHRDGLPSDGGEVEPICVGVDADPVSSSR